VAKSNYITNTKTNELKLLSTLEIMKMSATRSRQLRRCDSGWCDLIESLGNQTKDDIADAYIIIIIITDLYSTFRSKDTEALDAAQED